MANLLIRMVNTMMLDSCDICYFGTVPFVRVKSLSRFKDGISLSQICKIHSSCLTIGYNCGMRARLWSEPNAISDMQFWSEIEKQVMVKHLVIEAIAMQYT